jgi:hypothetical protein
MRKRWSSPGGTVTTLNVAPGASFTQKRTPEAS